MALNKILSGMLQDFKNRFSLDDIEEESKSFEYLVNYLMVSMYHPDAFSDRGDFDALVVDEKGQFGLDAVAVIVNGNLVLSKEDIVTYAKSKYLDIDILFIQSKTEEKCDSGDLLKTIQATKNFFEDFDKITEKNENIYNAREIVDEIFEYDNFQYCSNNSPKCHIYYACAANQWNESLIGDICESNEREIKNLKDGDLKDVEIKIIDRKYLIRAYREIQNHISVKIHFKNCLTLDKIKGVNEAYIGYLSGEEYLKIIMNSEGRLQRRIFYENVRDYQGTDNSVNKEISNTIKKENTRDQFVLLNNGVTVITRVLKSLGGNVYELSDFQIVNGCQTSNEIFNLKDCVKDIIVPVKIIYTTDSEIIASIVRATNRQSPVPEEAFVALDNYQKNLQMIFNEYSKEMPIEVFYERRPGEPDNISNKMGEYQIVKLHGVIRNVTSVFFQEPYVVHNNNPANILRNRKDKLFCEEQQPEMYYISSYLMVLFVHLQGARVLTKRDYKYRYYIMMIVYGLMTENVNIPDFTSRKLVKQNEKVISILKDQEKMKDYYLKARAIVMRTIEEDLFKSRRAVDILKSIEFRNRIKENTEKFLKNDIEEL